MQSDKTEKGQMKNATENKNVRVFKPALGSTRALITKRDGRFYAWVGSRADGSTARPGETGVGKEIDVTDAVAAGLLHFD